MKILKNHIFLIFFQQSLYLLKAVSRAELGAGDMDWARGRVLLKPEDQLPLTEAVRLILSLFFLNHLLNSFALLLL